MLRVGLTGGIGSGKSAAARHFAALGVPVIDADAIARELVEPGQPALGQVVREFGPQVLDATGRLDRARLRALVFGDTARRKRLEAILHPLIRAEMRARAAATEALYCILVIPLLFETGQQDTVDRVLVVDVPEEEQIGRVQARDGLGRDEVLAILRTQADRQTRLRQAHDIITNDGPLEALHRQVEALHRRYTELAHTP